MSRPDARPALATDWKLQEISPYVDWWRHVDKPARPQEAREVREIALLTKRALAKGDQEGTSGAYIRRNVPMWDWSLPPEATGVQESTASPTDQFKERMESLPQDTKALLVVIDTDINPLHERFRDGDPPHEQSGEGKGQPRILAHWMMEGRFDNNSARVPFGREVRTRDLVDAEQGRTEEEALQELGSHSLTEPFAPRGTAQLSAHGTHVLDLAGGTDPLDPSPEAQKLRKVPILAVSLPSNRLLSPSGTFLRAFVDQALFWVEARLSELLGSGARPRVVVNLSYGLSAGPKDGSGYLTGRIREFLVRHPGTEMFMPAGNDGRSDLHAVLHAKKGWCEVGWLVLPADPFSAFAEVWTTGNPEGHGLCLRTPEGVELLVRDLQSMNEAKELADPGPPDFPIARIYPLGAGAKDGRLGFLLCVAPTQRVLPDAAVAPAGVWTIGLVGTGDLRADVHLQSERPLTPRSLVGRPSRLLETGEVKPDPKGTLNEVPIGACRIVQAVRPPDNSPLPWTSQGDPTYVPPFKPDCLVEGEQSAARPWLRAAGARSGSTALVEGTSFACAKAAGAALVDAIKDTGIRSVSS